MTAEDDEPPRREAERIRYHADRAPEDEDRAIFQRQMRPPNPIEYLSEDDLERHRRLIEIEPELSKMVAGKRAWALVGETAKKVALWLSAISGGFLVLKEIIRSMAK